jgi:hypothetical protein
MRGYASAIERVSRIGMRKRLADGLPAGFKFFAERKSAGYIGGSLFRAYADWISTTDLSLALQEHFWVIPTSQSVHIVAVSVVFSCAVLINLRVMGVGPQDRTAPQLARVLLPWMWVGLGMLLLTGAIQTIAEPVRQFVTPVFWAKMIMVALVVLLTAQYSRVRFGQHGPSASFVPRALDFGFALSSTLIWVAIIACGRFIGYTSSLYV